MPITTALSSEAIAHSRAAAPINRDAQRLAETTLVRTGGRETYSWEDDRVRLRYDAASGVTTRHYRRGDYWSTAAPWRSDSGAGRINLALEHVLGCDDPVVEAKRDLVWKLLDPELDVVGWVIATNDTWHGLHTVYGQWLEPLALRLAEVLEQKILENPRAGLSLRQIADGAPIVGWAARMLDSCTFSAMRSLTRNVPIARDPREIACAR